jgi:hypothetical protein
MHYGTFRLSQEPMEEPVERLMAAAKLAGVASSVTVLPEGDTDVTEPVTGLALSKRAAQG